MAAAAQCDNAVRSVDPPDVYLDAVQRPRNPIRLPGLLLGAPHLNWKASPAGFAQAAAPERAMWSLDVTGRVSLVVVRLRIEPLLAFLLGLTMNPALLRARGAGRMEFRSAVPQRHSTAAAGTTCTQFVPVVAKQRNRTIL